MATPTDMSTTCKITTMYASVCMRQCNLVPSPECHTPYNLAFSPVTYIDTVFISPCANINTGRLTFGLFRTGLEQLTSKSPDMRPNHQAMMLALKQDKLVCIIISSLSLASNRFFESVAPTYIFISSIYC